MVTFGFKGDAKSDLLGESRITSDAWKINLLYDLKTQFLGLVRLRLGIDQYCA